MEKKLAVIIMAAGKGTRMNNPDVAKVMYPINGMPMVEHVVDLAKKLDSFKTVVIVGWQKDSVIEHLLKSGKPAQCVEQNPQLGTGHAVMQAEPVLQDFEGDVLVLSGDVPMLTTTTVQALLDCHRTTGASATVLTAILEDATGYGRIMRDTDESVLSIVEHKDATDAEKMVNEINTGIYVFDSQSLFEGLKHITPNNVQKEYYLTDVFGYFWKNKKKVSAVVVGSPFEIQGINTPEQLEAAQRAMSKPSS